MLMPVLQEMACPSCRALPVHLLDLITPRADERECECDVFVL